MRATAYSDGAPVFVQSSLVHPDNKNALRTRKPGYGIFLVEDNCLYAASHVGCLEHETFFSSIEANFGIPFAWVMIGYDK